MEDHYPQRIAAAAAGQAWKRAPVALETCGIPRDWYLLHPGRIDDILRYAVDNHASILNAKSSDIPVAWVEKLSRFTARIGYRLSFESRGLPEKALIGDDPGEAPRPDSPAGAYEVFIALVDPRTGEPTIRLDVPAVPGDLWYSLGTVQAAVP